MLVNFLIWSPLLINNQMNCLCAASEITSKYKENRKAFSLHVMNTRGRVLLTHALSKYQCLMSQLWCKLQCITYHQVTSSLVQNAVLGRICARVEERRKKKKNLHNMYNTYMVSFLRRCTVFMEQYRLTSKRGSLQKEYAVHGKFLITSLDKHWRRKMHHCTIMPPYCCHLHIHKRETFFFNYTIEA